jgi:type I restriction enzyme S subunit
MGDSCQPVPFGALLNGGVRNGVYKPSEFHGHGVKIVNMGELFAHPRLRSVPMKRLHLTALEIQRHDLQPGDLLFARRSLVAEGAGKCSIVLEVDEPTVFESSIIRARPDPKRAVSAYLYYLFSSPHGAYLLDTIRRGAVVSGITGSDLVNLNLPLPSIAKQEAIVHILGNLDDKIELNRRMNATLEAMARALFQSWFVDFDPVRRNAAGLSPLPLGEGPGVREQATDSKAYDHLFPSEFDESELGLIPRGWAVRRIGDVVECVGGGTPSTAEAAYWEDGVHHWATPKDLSGLRSPMLLDTERRLTDAGVAKVSSGLLPAGTLLLSSRAPVGYLAIATMPVAINQGFIALKSSPQASSYFLLNWCRANMPEIEARATGTTFAEISKQNFRPILVVLPPQSVMAAFSAIVAQWYQRIEGNLREARTLSQLRDSLLPRLLSGELGLASLQSEVEPLV